MIPRENSLSDRCTSDRCCFFSSLMLYTLRKLYFQFLSNWMEYDHSGSFPFDFEHKWNSIWFGKSKGKLSPWSYPIQCERKWKCSFLSVQMIDRMTRYRHQSTWLFLWCLLLSMEKRRTLMRKLKPFVVRASFWPNLVSQTLLCYGRKMFKSFMIMAELLLPPHQHWST